eukprot:gnl/TRDRNA2_/TRDRNA2_189316_c0_seq1.p1 gnl/TRDRNA2_/TRDRNA2_189316_c0~~gnl/TRDRNA2_/TRDRNA2_189316_c0_seq1.p1  ORF type:complete len:244 (+),score=71.85 gnl/TRDRNA2_/TRDRNA2_189316_c0_seq1:137-868(+)
MAQGDMKSLMQEVLAEAKAPEWRWRLNKIDSCSDEEPTPEAKAAWLQAAGGGAQANLLDGGGVEKMLKVTQATGRKNELAEKNPSQSLLHEVVFLDNIERIAKVMDRGIDVNTPDCMGDTPLMWANSAEVVDYLVGEGADVEARNVLSGCSVFFKMAYQGKHRPLKAVAKYLQKAGKLDEAIQDTASITKRTALHAAALNGCVEVVKELLSYGADRDAEDLYGKTPLDLATENKFEDVVTLLE